MLQLVSAILELVSSVWHLVLASGIWYLVPDTLALSKPRNGRRWFYRFPFSSQLLLLDLNLNNQQIGPWLK